MVEIGEWISRTWFVVPTYNEGPVLSEVVGSLILTGAHVCVVDDCSRDNTSEIARLAGAHLIRHPINLGQGAALQTGLQFALSRGADIIVTFDADGQHQVKDALELARSVAEDSADIVCGSRFIGISARNMPLARIMLLKLATLFTRLSTGVPVTDVHNGLRALNANAARRIYLTQNRMAHASELIAQVGAQGLRYGELPVEIVYSGYSLKKGQRLSNSFNILVDLVMGRFL